VFPTQRPGDGVILTPLQDLLGETAVKWVHYTATAIFVGSLALISYYFAKPSPRKGKLPISFWRRYHLVCAGLIVTGLALAAEAAITSWPDKGLLLAEVIAVWAFGASWLAKGLELRVLLGRSEVPSAAAAEAGLAAEHAVAPETPPGLAQP
jgi:uncharacterized membrane protein